MDATKKLTEEYKSKNTFRYVKDGIEYTTPAFDFHIFSTEAILSAHTNGNIATKDLDSGGQGFGASIIKIEWGALLINNKRKKVEN